MSILFWHVVAVVLASEPADAGLHADGGNTHVDAPKKPSTEAHNSHSSPVDAGVEAPSIASISPAYGPAERTVTLTLQGKAFKSPLRIRAGPDGANIECPRARVVSDKIATCDLPQNQPADRAIHFIALAKSGSTWVSGEASTAKYVPVPAPTVIGVKVKAMDGYAQVHLIGRDLSLSDGPVPRVSYVDPASRRFHCENVVVISTSELFCYTKILSRAPSEDPSTFTVEPQSELDTPPSQ
jgi:hypothetical protein